MEYIIIYYIYRWNHGILPWSIYPYFDEILDEVTVKTVEKEMIEIW